MFVSVRLFKWTIVFRSKNIITIQGDLNLQRNYLLQKKPFFSGLPFARYVSQKCNFGGVHIQNWNANGFYTKSVLWRSFTFKLTVFEKVAEKKLIRVSRSKAGCKVCEQNWITDKIL